MNKYTRKQINLKPELHNKEFVLHADALKAIELLYNAAIEAGAVECKMMEFFNEKD